MEIIVTIFTGAIAGWIGSMLYKGSGFGFIGNIIIGILGCFVGYWLFKKFGINMGTGWVKTILTGAIGAIIILFLINLVFKKR